MFSIPAVDNPPKPQFRVGDTVRCMSEVQFHDGGEHKVGDLIQVSYGNINYLNMFREEYEQVSPIE